MSGQGVRREEKGGPRGFLAERAHALKAESGRSGRVELREGWGREWAAGKAVGEGCEMSWGCGGP